MAACTQPFLPTVRTASQRGETRLRGAFALLRFWHVASLDAPTVAVVWSYGFAWAVKIPLPVWAPVLLALIAWALYIGDRLLDARAGMQLPPLHHLRERHHFHWKWRWVMAPAGAMAGMTAAAIVMTRLPAGARAPDSALAAATLAYFSGVHSRGRIWRTAERMFAPLWCRALVIGVLFTAACLLPAASQVAYPELPSLVRALGIPALFYAALGWLNCHAIGKWEGEGARDGENGVEGKAAMLGGVGSWLAVLLISQSPHVAALLAAGSTSALLFVLLERMRGRMTPLALRAAADLVLLTPALVLVFGSR